MVYVKLVPVHGQDETLCNNAAKRPCLEWKPGDTTPIMLGRNHATQISAVGVSRFLAKISVFSDKVYLSMMKQPMEHRFCLRGQRVAASMGTCVELHDQDRLSLQGEKYEYVVLIKNDAESFSNASVAAAAPPVETSNNSHHDDDEDDKTLYHDMTEEALCAVCMDIMVDSTAIVPCGHAFCQSCLQSLTECPNCREKIRHGIRVRNMDNMIWHTVRSRLFSPDDVQSYLTRSRRNISNDERQRLMRGPPRKRQRVEENEHSQETVASVDIHSAKRVPSSVPTHTTTTSMHDIPLAVDLTSTSQGGTIEDAICID